MKTISLVLITVIIVVVDIFLFSEDVLYGVGGVIGIVAFFFAYSISGDMIIAPRDYWRLSSWGVFKKKFGYGVGVYIMTTFVACCLLSAIFS